MKAKILNFCRADAEALDTKLLDARGHLLVHDADVYKAIPRDLLRAWCSWRGRYLVPTTELVGFLKELLRATPVTATLKLYGNVIEIGAGMGDLGRALGIPSTDSCVQTDPWMRLLYSALGQAVTEPPRDVHRLEAMEAVEKYRPHTVVGAFITQKWQEGDGPGVGAFVHGVDEEAMLSKVRRYILIGNENVHGDKRIMARPHETICPGWLVTRASDPSKDRIWIFEGGQC